MTAFGRYLDSDCDLIVNAALFAAIGHATGLPLLATAGFVASTLVLSLNFNLRRLYAGAAAMPEGGGLARRFYELVYAPQDRVADRLVAPPATVVDAQGSPQPRARHPAHGARRVPRSRRTSPPEQERSRRMSETVVALPNSAGALAQPRVRSRAEDWNRYRENMAEILEALGLPPGTPGTRDTPERFLRALFEATAGYDGDPKLVTTFPTESDSAGRNRRSRRSSKGRSPSPRSASTMRFRSSGMRTSATSPASGSSGSPS